jgi:hypothetical protein
MSGGQDWAAELIDTSGSDMSDKQSCRSSVSGNDLILDHILDVNKFLDSTPQERRPGKAAGEGQGREVVSSHRQKQRPRQ